MPRWEEGSEERLKRAAMELFEEQGFDGTSAVQIARRARVTSRTFFRYFPDKEEILFADAAALEAALLEEMRQVPDVAAPLVTVVRVLARFDWPSLGPREIQRRRDAMIRATPRLRERELIKQQQVADGFSDALRGRGVDPDTAELAARVGIDVFYTTYRRWLESSDGADLLALTDATLSRLAAIVPSTRQAVGPSGRRPVRPSARRLD
jgi:AcrR family transcriptional regulator